jgi:hypothetical protein
MLSLPPTSNDLHAAHLFQVVVKSYRSCSFTAATRVQIPDGNGDSEPVEKGAEEGASQVAYALLCDFATPQSGGLA